MNLNDLLQYSNDDDGVNTEPGQYSFALSETVDDNEGILNTLLMGSPRANGDDDSVGSWGGSDCKKPDSLSISDVDCNSTGGGNVVVAGPSPNTNLVGKHGIRKRLYRKAIPEESDLKQSISTLMYHSTQQVEQEKEQKRLERQQWISYRAKLARNSVKRRRKKYEEAQLDERNINSSLKKTPKKEEPEIPFHVTCLSGIPDPPEIPKQKPFFKVKKVNDLTVFKAYEKDMRKGSHSTCVSCPLYKGYKKKWGVYHSEPQPVPQEKKQVSRDEKPTRKRTQRLYEDAQAREEMRQRTKALSQKLARSSVKHEMDVIMGRA
eukprot:TRINITY_DN9290_c0_g2_i1.p1 TRINITY_DN9290_c0_g2~~TRINITY_DN9290_c0_g2_i1.p1  ORF type:complete len:320 (+),score=65.29 TRINITY_DN9290_c0_g2_i1:55-1014(+)